MDMDMDMEMEMENMAMDEYFDEAEIKDVKCLYELLMFDLQNTKISNLRDKHNKMKKNIFVETIDDILYRGYIQYNYMDCSRFKNLGNCLYITHIMISPRKGNFFKPTLKRILNENKNIDSIFIESIMSNRVIQSFIDDGWIIDNCCAILKK